MTYIFFQGGVHGLEEYQRASVTSDIKYTIGPAGTGQPSVKYQQLLFKVSAFYALGSPIGCFVAVRGIESLGSDFKVIFVMRLSRREDEPKNLVFFFSLNSFPLAVGSSTSSTPTIPSHTG